MCSPLISRKNALVPLVRETTDEYVHAVLAPESARRAGDGVARAASRIPVTIRRARSQQHIRLVVSGEMWVDQKVIQMMADEVQQGEEASPAPLLT
jgi:hypothetical protein